MLHWTSLSNRQGTAFIGQKLNTRFSLTQFAVMAKYKVKYLPSAYHQLGQVYI